MDINNEITNLIYKFKNAGEERLNDGAILIGKAPFKGTNGWLNIIFPSLKEEEIDVLEMELKTSIPKPYRDFLLNYSNGLNILSSTFTLYGLRRQVNRSIDHNLRQPYSIITPNIYERPNNAKNSYFFIGGYNWDGSHLFIDNETNIIHCCERWDATSKIQWNSLEEMIVSEMKRLYLLFDEEGKEIDEDIKTTPY